jgi:acetolactate synthase-1/2/3 large subunit
MIYISKYIKRGVIIMKLNGAQVLLKCLIEQGVDIIFGYPGGAVLPIYDALYSMNEITHILTAHEQGASHAADGYARSTGKVGVVLATSGPGATNTVTGIATAYSDSIPLVIITGQVAQNLIGKNSFQEVDITGITVPITKKNYLVKNIKELADTIREAFKIAKEGRPGPVLVDIPKDIQAEEIDYIETTELDNEKIEDSYEDNDFEEVLKAITISERPVIYAGGGIIISNAHNELEIFANKIDAPVTCSFMGIGAFPGNDERYMGMVGMHGSRCSNYAVSKCDLLIAIGARFSDRVVSKAETFASNAKIVHIDIDPKEFGKNVEIHMALRGDIKQVLTTLNKKIAQKNNGDWFKQIEEWKKIKPREFKNKETVSPKVIMEKLYELTEGNCIITTEVGQNQIWAAQYFKFLKPRTFISSGGFGTMGYGLGAAIGASLGNPGVKVINVAGDGSFKMNSTELATVAKYRLPIVQLVLNNHALGMVHQWQDMFYQGRFSNTKLGPDVDFIKLAYAYGIKAIRVNSNDEIEKALKEALSLTEPVIVECEISREEKVYPIVPPGASITELID